MGTYNNIMFSTQQELFNAYTIDLVKMIFIIVLESCMYTLDQVTSALEGLSLGYCRTEENSILFNTSAIYPFTFEVCRSSDTSL